MNCYYGPLAGGTYTSGLTGSFVKYFGAGLAATSTTVSSGAGYKGFCNDTASPYKTTIDANIYYVGCVACHPRRSAGGHPAAERTGCPARARDGT